MSDDHGTPDERDAEVERLRSEVARLQSQLASEKTPVPASGSGGRTGAWRPLVSGVLIVIAALLAPLSVVASWAHDEIGDTTRYVDTVAPLASDPAVQQAISDRITTEIFNRIDVKAVTQQAVDALAARGLPPQAAAGLNALATPLANGVHSFVAEKVDKLVKSPQFEAAWVAANREAHTQMVALLTGKTNGNVTVEGNSVQVNLAAVIDTVKQQLVASGFTLASRIPEVNAQFTILESADLTRAQTGFRVLGALARTLPWVAVILLVIAVWIARSRRRAIVVAALAVAASMLLLGITLNVFRQVYLNAVPPDQLPTAAAASIYDALAHFVRLSLRSVLVLFLAIAAIAWVTGPSTGPVAVRRGSTRAVDYVRHGSDRAGLNTGRFGEAVYASRTPIRVAVLGLALLIYVLAAHPTGGFTLLVLGIALLVLLVVEVVARPPASDQPG